MTTLFKEKSSQAATADDLDGQPSISDKQHPTPKLTKAEQLSHWQESLSARPSTRAVVFHADLETRFAFTPSLEQAHQFALQNIIFSYTPDKKTTAATYLHQHINNFQIDQSTYNKLHQLCAIKKEITCAKSLERVLTLFCYLKISNFSSLEMLSRELDPHQAELWFLIPELQTVLDTQDWEEAFQAAERLPSALGLRQLGHKEVARRFLLITFAGRVIDFFNWLDEKKLKSQKPSKKSLKLSASL